MQYAPAKQNYPFINNPHSLDSVRLRRKMITQIQAKGITNPKILKAMEIVPRHMFVPNAWKIHAYNDTALPIGNGQTISQPSMVAKMLDLLQIEQGMTILEIGMGSGYQTALLATLGCRVYAIERLRDLYVQANNRFRKLNLRGIHIHCTDGTLGLPEAAPFDRIIVAAGGPSIPEPLIVQLSTRGIMLIPVGPKQRMQRLIRVINYYGKITYEDMGPAMFVNLVGDHGWDM